MITLEEVIWGTISPSLTGKTERVLLGDNRRSKKNVPSAGKLK